MTWAAVLGTTACAVAIVGNGAAARATGPGPSLQFHTLRLDVSEWSVVPSDGDVAAGPTRVRVTNYGTEVHVLRIVRTPEWGAALPVRGGRVVGQRLGRPLRVEPGVTVSERVVLRPGTYEALDDLPGRYGLGTWIAFTVE